MEDPDNPQILFGRQWRAALYLFSAMIKMSLAEWSRCTGGRERWAIPAVVLVL